MPTALRIGPYRLFFYSSDRREPPHVHVEREARQAKVWLDPVRLADGGGFGEPELQRIVRLVAAHRDFLLPSWHDHFTD